MRDAPFHISGSPPQVAVCLPAFKTTLYVHKMTDVSQSPPQKKEEEELCVRVMTYVS